MREKSKRAKWIYSQFVFSKKVINKQVKQVQKASSLVMLNSTGRDAYPK